MSKLHNKRIYSITCLLVLVSIGVGCILWAFSNNINLFYTPSELVEKKDDLSEVVVRLGGLVKKGSIRHKENLDVSFILTDNIADIEVLYSGVLPDLFREGQGIVSLGNYVDGKFIAKTVYAKHDENYSPVALKKKLGNNYYK